MPTIIYKLTLASVISEIIDERDADPNAGILHHPEGVDLLTANSSLACIKPAQACSINITVIASFCVVRRNVLVVNSLCFFPYFFKKRSGIFA
ncbi:MAG: hypothetical protein LBC28_05880, partial [Oscillospiraceae bacterium]|nr:hypothetical protein [Oscillospiraceae bacterium]